MASANNTPAEKPVKKSIMQVVIENNYLKQIVSGDIWKLTETEIKEVEENLEKFRKVVAAALKMHDEELATRRTIQGNDYMKSLEFFRKPRESKAGNSLLDDLQM